MTLATTLLEKNKSFASYPGNFSISNDGRFLGSTYLEQNASDSYIPNNLLTKIKIRDLSTGTEKLIASPTGEIGNVLNFVLSGDGSTLAFSFQNGYVDPIQIYVTDLQTGKTKLASGNAIGNAANKSAGLNPFTLSNNGRYLSFSTEADNLLPSDRKDDNHRFDVFLKDLRTGTVTLVSQSSTGTLADDNSYASQVSQDGRYVLFESSANNLVGNPPYYNLLVKDMQTGAIQIGNQDADGYAIGVRNFNNDLGYLSDNQAMFLSADGSKLGFTDIYRRVYLKDLKSGALSLVSSDENGQAIRGKVTLVAVSSDGHLVTFSAPGKKIVQGLPYFDQQGQVHPGELIGLPDLFQKDMLTGKVSLLTPHGSNLQASSYFPYASSANGAQLLLKLDSQTAYLQANENRPNLSTDSPLFLLQQNGLTRTQGDDTLFGDASGNKLIGGLGNDHYLVNHLQDRVIENAKAGVDTVYSLLDNYVLPENIENLELNWAKDTGMPTLSTQNGIGNELDNLMLGNALNNVLLGLDGNDRLFGGAGNDYLGGGEGFDIVQYLGKSNSVSISKLDGGLLLAARDGSERDQLQGIERIEFADLTISFQGDTNAAQAYRLYQGAFNRVPDKGGLGYWISQFEHGLTGEHAAQSFMQSGEFKSMYGVEISHQALVDKFYQNVLHRAGDLDGQHFWTGLLDSQQITPAQVLAAFADSPENQAALVGVMEAGFAFIPFAG